MATERKSGIFSKIETSDDALKAVRSTSAVFFVVAAIQAVVGFVLDAGLWFDAIAFALFGFLLRRFNSRAAAVVLLLLAVLGLLVTFANKIGAGTGGGTNIFLAALVVGAGIRAVRATWKLHGLLAEGDVTIYPGIRRETRPPTVSPAPVARRAQTYLPQSPPSGTTPPSSLPRTPASPAPT